MEENIEAYVMKISSLESKMRIYPAKKTPLALLITEKVTVIAKNLDFTDVFLEKSANVLLEQTKANKHTIELEKGKQLPYELIYNLGPVELETLKTFIKTNPTNGFIQALNSPAGALIQFVCKFNNSFCFCVNYLGLNNLTIKNRYLLPLIGQSPNQLGQVKQFTQLYLTSGYHWMRIKKGNKWKTAFPTWYGHFIY